MDYKIVNEDGDIMIEINEGNSTQRNRLLEYYSKLQTEDGDETSDKKNEVLKRIAFSMSEEDAKGQCSRIEEATKKRLMAYHKALSDLHQKHTDELQEIKDTVNDLIEAYEDYDFNREKTVEINGNFFTYDPEQFDVEKHKDSLASLGKESKGNTWRVEIDEAGEVVLHWRVLKSEM